MKRAVKLMLIAAIVFSLVASSVFLIINFDHECSDCTHCHVCHMIESAFGILKGIFTAVSVLVCWCLLKRLDAIFETQRSRTEIKAETPILLRVKLNN